MNDERNEEIEIDLVQLASVIWHNIWIVIISAIVCGAAAFSISFFMITPLYEASTMVYINNSTTIGSLSISAADLTASKSLAQTFEVILTSHSVQDEIIEMAGVDYNRNQIKSIVSAADVNNTEILSITATTPDPEISARIADAATDVASKKMMEVIEGCSVRNIDYALVPVEKSSPNIRSNTLIGIVVGILLSIAFLVIMELMDSQVRTETELKRIIGDVPVLGVIPSFESQTSEGKYEKYGYGYGSYEYANSEKTEDSDNTAMSA